MGVIKRVKKPTSHRGKKILEKKESQVIEGPKRVIIMRGRRASEVLQGCIKDLNALKKPDVLMASQKNFFLPFEDVTPIENFCRKQSAPLFIFASSNKKRPNNLIFGRLFDYQLLDMVELEVKKFKSIEEFGKETILAGSKPCLLFAGEIFDSNPELTRVKNMFIDFFHREHVNSIRLLGLQHIIMFTALEGLIFLRSYRASFTKTIPGSSPRIELEEIGPAIDFELGRTRLASDDLFKASCKKPKELRIKKTKNVSTNVLGTKEARIHVPKQNISQVQPKKMKGLRKEKNKSKNVKKVKSSGAKSN